MKYLIECMDELGVWHTFNFFEGSIIDVKMKMAQIISKTKYIGIKCSKVNQ